MTMELQEMTLAVARIAVDAGKHVLSEQTTPRKLNRLKVPKESTQFDLDINYKLMDFLGQRLMQLEPFNGLWNGLFGNRKASVTVEKRAVDAATSRSAGLASASRMIADAPRLATGSVIPPNREFLAVLGDNTRETEVVSPVSTMKQAFIEAMREMGMGDGTFNFTVNLDGKTVAKNTVKHINNMTRQAGKPVLLF